ncbi:MAG TPA: hypothetical protein VL461_15915 [Dictyobacter sp.]|jgi:hypothetical protein|nr:hypothetical protein [Dictyobacter sp.]
MSQKGIAMVVFALGLSLAFLMSSWFLPIIFITLACTSLLSFWNWRNIQSITNSLHSFVWMAVLALCFATQQWALLLLAIAFSCFLAAGHNYLASLFQHPVVPAAQSAVSGPLSHPGSSPSAATPVRPRWAEEAEHTYAQGYQGTQRTRTTVELSPDPDGTWKDTEAPIQSELYEQPLAQYPEPPQP